VWDIESVYNVNNNNNNSSNNSKKGFRKQSVTPPVSLTHLVKCKKNFSSSLFFSFPFDTKIYFFAKETLRRISCLYVYVCVCVCGEGVCVWKREVKWGERRLSKNRTSVLSRPHSHAKCVFVFVCVCEFVWERGRARKIHTRSMH